MPLRASIATIAFLAAFFILACGDERPAEILASGPGRAIDPEKRGPYPVGVRTVWIEDETRSHPYDEALPRRIPVEIWYPADASAEGLEHDVIAVMDDAPEAARELLEGVDLSDLIQTAARDAEIRADQGRFPVLVFSHGMGAVRQQSITYTTHLASHGYVVLAPQHVGDTLFDVLMDHNVEGSVVVALNNRPLDVSLLLDRVVEGSLTDGWLEPFVNTRRVGITGHSFGGLVSVLMTHPYSEFYDPRFSVSVPITPATVVVSLLTGTDLSHIEVPTFYVGATADRLLDYQDETVDAYEQHLSDKGLAGVIDAGHYSFCDVCDLRLAELAADLGLESEVQSVLDDGCGEDNIPVEIALDRLNRYATAWFNTYLRGSEETADIWLHPDSAPEDVEYRVAR